MKAILIGLLAFGSLSGFANSNCKVFVGGNIQANSVYLLEVMGYELVTVDRLQASMSDSMFHLRSIPNEEIERLNAGVLDVGFLVADRMFVSVSDMKCKKAKSKLSRYASKRAKRQIRQEFKNNLYKKLDSYYTPQQSQVSLDGII